ncbi:hypothetical protein IJS98_05980 [bacterium]|nr:hypothetical protein [bacterium]
MRELKFYIPKVRTKRQGKILALSLAVSLIIIIVLALGLKVEEPERETPPERPPLQVIILK